MPNSKISALTSGSTIQTSDEIPVNRGGSNRKVTVASMATQAASAVAITGGTIDATTIGATTPANGTFYTLIGRQSGGVSGTDEVQILHNGTNGRVVSKDGFLLLETVAGIVLALGNTTSAVNYATITHTTTGNRVTYAGTSGTDTNVGLEFRAKGDPSSAAILFAYNNGSNNLMVLHSAVNSSSVPFKVPSYNVAGAPSASTAGAGSMIYVTNGNAGAACLAISDGTNWKVDALGATISAT